MSRVQLALRVAEPPLKLVLLAGEGGEPTRMDHLGVEVPSTDEVTAAPAVSPGRSAPSPGTPVRTWKARPSMSSPSSQATAPVARRRGLSR